jgi:hypothetical protein
LAGTCLESAGRTSTAREHLRLQCEGNNHAQGAFAPCSEESRVSELAAYYLVCPNLANPNCRLPGWLSIFHSVTWIAPSTMR